MIIRRQKSLKKDRYNLKKKIDETYVIYSVINPPPLKIYFKKINIFKNFKNELNKRNEKKNIFKQILVSFN